MGSNSLVSKVKASGSARKLQQSASDQMTLHDCPLKLALRMFGLTIHPENELLRTQDDLLQEFFQKILKE